MENFIMILNKKKFLKKIQQVKKKLFLYNIV